MIRQIFLLLIILFSLSKIVFPQDSLFIIPQPVSMERGSGHFNLTRTTVIEMEENDTGIENVASMLAADLKKATGFTLFFKKVTAFSDGNIHLKLYRGSDTLIGKEGYNLMISSKGADMTAATPAGLFYAMQTLLQLFTPDIESNSVITKLAWKIPSVRITDYPRFAWRGLMLDVARHFFTVNEVKQFIDDMAKYKFNVFHWHLTDDDGWRIEIKSFPKLTEIGAWRPNRVGTYTFFQHPAPDEPNTYGGFYTQDQIKEVVNYAAKKFINVIPEIDVPGHSLAAIAAYPNLASFPGNYRPCSGDSTMVWPKDGPFYALFDNSLCAGKEEVYDFLDKVFTEVAALFPFEYIHIGGDENAKNFWEKSEDIKKLMKRENIPSIDLVQNYFTRRVEKIIEAKGKKVIGWDEILEGKLDPNTIVMSWQGTKGGVAASKRKLNVVFAPNSYAYLNYMQGDPAVEPPVHSTKYLKDCYAAEPIAEGVDPQYVKGVQANLWTEQVYNYRHLQYMVWPRAFAISEMAWTPANRKNWPEFIRRIENHFIRFNYADKKFAPSIYDPIISVTEKADHDLQLHLTRQIEGLDLYYSFDNSYPDNHYQKYNGNIDVPKEASLFRVISYRHHKPIGRMISITIDELKKRAN